MKTFSLKTADVTRSWVLVDASDASLGKVASAIATRLIGKYQPQFTHHIDSGDFVIVINADKLVVTGKKMEQKRYYRHSQYPGSLKEETLAEKMVKNPESVIIAAVKGMLPKNKLQAGRLARLKVFTGSEHPHTAQQPTKLEIK